MNDDNKNQPGPDGFFRQRVLSVAVDSPLQLETAAADDGKARPKDEAPLNAFCSQGDIDCIKACAARACEVMLGYGYVLNPVLVAADLMCVHCNGQPMHLTRLLLSDAADFEHDIGGIWRHLDRKSGKLLHGWKPIFAMVAS